MKKINVIKLLVGLVLVSFLTGCQESGKAEIQSVPNRNYSVLKPASWSVMSDLNDEADLGMGSTFNDAFCIIISEPKSDFEDGVTLDHYSGLTLPDVKEGLLGYSDSGREDMEIDGSPAIRYVISGIDGGVKVKYWHVVVDAGGHYHQVFMWTSASRYKRNKKDFENVLQSFKATDTAVAKVSVDEVSE